MDVPDLRVQANQEHLVLGDPPGNAREHEMRREEGRGAVLLLAALANHDGDELRGPAATEWVAPGACDLLIAAAEDCR